MTPPRKPHGTKLHKINHLRLVKILCFRDFVANNKMKYHVFKIHQRLIIVRN